MVKKALALGLLVLGIAVAFFFWGAPGREAPPEGTRIIFVGETPVRVMIADTDAARTQGLSKHPGLSEDEGMLFVFPTSGERGFWMKDMLFSIDIIWISDSGAIVDIDERVSPDTFPGIFTPSEPISFVLEVPAGFVERHGVGRGTVVRF